MAVGGIPLRLMLDDIEGRVLDGIRWFSIVCGIQWRSPVGCLHQSSQRLAEWLETFWLVSRVRIPVLLKFIWLPKGILSHVHFHARSVEIGLESGEEPSVSTNVQFKTKVFYRTAFAISTRSLSPSL